MIGKLKGTIDTITQDHLIIDVGGVGYLVFCSNRTLNQFEVGHNAGLLIETHVREDHIHLYGFMDTVERDWFKLLTTVQGVGVRVALAILSILDSNELFAALMSGDKTAFTRVSGVGPKLGGRIVSELKDKASHITGISQVPAGGNSGIAVKQTGTDSADNKASEDAISALVNLGYERTVAWRAVTHVYTSEMTVSELIGSALKELAKDG